METLKSLREKAGLSAEEVARQGAAINPSFPTTPHAIYNIERRGTDSYLVLSVLSRLYSRSLEDIVAAATRDTKSAVLCNNFSHKP